MKVAEIQEIMLGFGICPIGMAVYGKTLLSKKKCIRTNLSDEPNPSRELGRKLGVKRDTIAEIVHEFDYGNRIEAIRKSLRNRTLGRFIRRAMKTFGKQFVSQ